MSLSSGCPPRPSALVGRAHECSYEGLCAPGAELHASSACVDRRALTFIRNSTPQLASLGHDDARAERTNVRRRNPRRRGGRRAGEWRLCSLRHTKRRPAVAARRPQLALHPARRQQLVDRRREGGARGPVLDGRGRAGRLERVPVRRPDAPSFQRVGACARAVVARSSRADAGLRPTCFRDRGVPRLPRPARRSRARALRPRGVRAVPRARARTRRPAGSTAASGARSVARRSHSRGRRTLRRTGRSSRRSRPSRATARGRSSARRAHARFRTRSRPPPGPRPRAARLRRSRRHRRASGRPWAADSARAWPRSSWAADSETSRPPPRLPRRSHLKCMRSITRDR